jgi:uncharacterized membrane protein SirB2
MAKDKKKSKTVEQMRKEMWAKGKKKKKKAKKKAPKVSDSLLLRAGAFLGKALASKKRKKDDDNPIF